MKRYTIAILRSHGRSIQLFTLALFIVSTAGGCHCLTRRPPATTPLRLPPVGNTLPRELDKAVLPEYRVEPPDILSIEVMNVVPSTPYRLRILDVLDVEISDTLPEVEIAGGFPVELGGLVDLGPVYGTVKVSGLTVEEAQQAIVDQAKKAIREPKVTVSLGEMGSLEQISGDYLVGPDGAVTLGSYGNALVVGMTLNEAREMIRQHLSQYLDEPIISITVTAYNSKVYYVILQGAGLGDGIYRVPVTGNETVLDALAQLNGLAEVSSKKIWIARPNRQLGNFHILPVDYFAVTELAEIGSNYQILPGDRVFVAEDKLVAFDNALAKFTAPFERIFGFSILGAETVTRFSGRVLQGGGNPRGRGL